MKPNYGYNPLFTTSLLWLLILLVSSITSVIAFPTQATQRKIVSDDFTKNRREADSKSKFVAPIPKPRRIYRLASTPAIKTKPTSAANVIGQLGITIWRLRPAGINDSGHRALIREKGKSVGWVAERVKSDATFREGDYV